MNKHCKNPFFLSFAGHVMLLLVFAICGYFDSPQLIQMAGGGGFPEQQEKPIIQAALINNDSVKTAIDRQEQQERDKQKKLEVQKANAEKIKKEAEHIKAEAEKLKLEVAEIQKKAEKDKQLAMVAKAEAENARLQAVKEQEKVKLEKVKLEKEQAAKKVELDKQKKLQASKELEQVENAKKHAAEQQAANEQARINSEKAKQQAQQAQQASQAAAAAQAAAGAAKQLAARNSWLDGEFTKYVGALQQRIYNNRTLSLAFGPELVCRIQIKLLPDGSVHDVKITQSSGNAAYDSASEAAVYKSSPFDMPEDLELVSKLRDIILEFGIEDNG